MLVRSIKMPKTITQYDLLISCPSDVKQELEIVNDTIKTFNNFLGAANGVAIMPRHWSTDSYPEAGDVPQKIINKQIVNSCDAAVAVFWTRFGTPTDDYGSGTEEEIEELIKSGKQVFLYFSDCPISPSALDKIQYEKVQYFRERYKERGLYGTYSTLEEFKKSFLNHLSRYFLNIFEGHDCVKTQSKLCIKGVSDRKPYDTAKGLSVRLSESPYIIDKKNGIIDTIEGIKNIKLPIREKEIEEQEAGGFKISKELQETIKGLQGSLKYVNDIFPCKPANVDDCKEAIGMFALNNKIDIQEDFYYLGNLRLSSSPTADIIFGGGITESPVGSDEEIKKYKLINELKKRIEQFEQLRRYLHSIDSNIYLELVLCNTGTDFDEDIDVELFVPKGYMCLPDQLPIPEDDIIGILNRSIEKIYKPKKTIAIDEYNDRFSMPKIPNSYAIAPYGVSYDRKLRMQREDFDDKLKEIFCYEFFDHDGYDVIRYNQKYLKQNTNIFFPSYLVFKTMPGQIEYRITSKRCPTVIDGEIVCEL